MIQSKMSCISVTLLLGFSKDQQSSCIVVLVSPVFVIPRHPRYLSSWTSSRFAPRLTSLCWHSIVSVVRTMCFYLSGCGPPLTPHPSVTWALFLRFPENKASQTAVTKGDIKCFNVNILHYGRWLKKLFLVRITADLRRERSRDGVTGRETGAKVAWSRCDHESKHERERQGPSGMKGAAQGKSNQQEGWRWKESRDEGVNRQDGSQCSIRLCCYRPAGAKAAWLLHLEACGVQIVRGRWWCAWCVNRWVWGLFINPSGVALSRG